MTLGSNTEERLNNAVAQLSLVAGHDAGVKSLTGKWTRFWHSPERKLNPTPVLLPTLEMYAREYASTWSRLPPAVRAKAPDPRTIDVSLGNAVSDALRNWREGLEDTGQIAKDAAKAVAKGLEGVLSLAVIAGVVYLLLRRR